MSHGRRGGRGPRNAGPSKVDLIPTLPPLYPQCPLPEPLDESLNKHVSKFNEMTQYMISNYRVGKNTNNEAAFVVQRYSDSYSAPLKLDEKLMDKLDPRRMPQELGPESIKKPVKSSQNVAEIKSKLAFEKLVTTTEEEKEEEEDDEPPAKKIKKDPDADDDENEKPVTHEDEEKEEEEIDEELDEGTDYMSSFFDNGEGFGDSDEDNIDDNSVY